MAGGFFGILGLHGVLLGRVVGTPVPPAPVTGGGGAGSGGLRPARSPWIGVELDVRRRLEEEALILLLDEF